MGVNKELWNDFVDYVTKDANENQKSLFRKELFNTVNKHQVYKEQGLDQLLFEQYLQPEQYRTEGENILADLMTRENLPHPNHVEEFWNKVGKDIKNFERKEKLTIKVILLIAGTLTLAAAGVAIGAVLVPGAAISAAITSAVTSIGMGNVIAIGASAITALSIGAGLSMHSLTKDKKKIILEQFKKSLSDEIDTKKRQINNSIEAHKGNEKKIKQMNKDLETKTKQILNELQKEKAEAKAAEAEAKAAEEEKNKQKKIGEEIEEKIQLLGEEIKQQKEAKELEKAAEVRKKSEELEAKAAEAEAKAAEEEKKIEEEKEPAEAEVAADDKWVRKHKNTDRRTRKDRFQRL